VLICDERPSVRQLLSGVVERAAGLRLSGITRTGAELLAHYADERPDVVVAGSSESILPWVGQLLAGAPAAVVLVCIADGDLAAELPAGVRGCFLLQPAPTGADAGLITLLLAGVGARRNADLSTRELQVLRAIGRGRSNLEIGRELFLAEQTVKVHVRTLFRKLGVQHRAQAVAYGLRTGLID
jgi:DNA-binding NarL/FixJ family response regulator